MCPPYIQTVAALPLEVQENYFSTIFLN